MSSPNIATAIPLRRYKLGEFSIVVLGEIESSDDVDYRYIVAVIREGDPEPGIYLSAQRNNTPDAAAGRYDMRLSMRDGEEIIGSSDAWGNLDVFVNDALEIAGKVLNLSDESPRRLM